MTNTEAINGGGVGTKPQAAFAAQEIPFSSVPTAGTPEYADFISHYVSAVFSFVRSSPEWKKTKTFTNSPADGGVVQCRVLPSGMQGKLAKCGWQLRESKHKIQDTKLEYEDFRRYLRFNHAGNERLYITDITHQEILAVVDKVQLEVVYNSYKLPIVTADRDFVQGLLTLDLPPHENPFSEEHEQITLSSIRDSSMSPSTDPVAAEGKASSFLVIQFPIAHPDKPEQSPKVRAVYASFEAVWQGQDQDGSNAVNWKMAVQSDTRGKIPTFMQEQAMPGEIAHDVSAFITWARKYKAENNH